MTHHLTHSFYATEQRSVGSVSPSLDWTPTVAQGHVLVESGGIAVDVDDSGALLVSMPDVGELRWLRPSGSWKRPVSDAL